MGDIDNPGLDKVAAIRYVHLIKGGLNEIRRIRENVRLILRNRLLNLRSQ